MIPTNVGGSPRQKPGIPSCLMIAWAIATGLFDSKSAMLEDCSCVLMTSNGFVTHDATVPATPPERNLSHTRITWSQFVLSSATICETKECHTEEMNVLESLHTSCGHCLHRGLAAACLATPLYLIYEFLTWSVIGFIAVEIAKTSLLKPHAKPTETSLCWKKQTCCDY